MQPENTDPSKSPCEDCGQDTDDWCIGRKGPGDLDAVFVFQCDPCHAKRLNGVVIENSSSAALRLRADG